MSLSLPGGVTQINESTFQGCASLTALGDMGNITTVGEYAFSGCKNLSFESMTNPLQEIDNYAFNGKTTEIRAQIGEAVPPLASYWIEKVVHDLLNYN